MLTSSKERCGGVIMARARGPAADAINGLEAAGEALLMADKSWHRYVESLDSDETRSTRYIDATSAAREIQKLRRNVKALSERLQAASTT